MVTVIDCYGTPYEIGYAHGKGAKQQIRNSIDFYIKFNKEVAKKDWDDLKPLAFQFKAAIMEKAPYLQEEMEGIAAGSGVDIVDIMILNARYEIGLAGSGFTSRLPPPEAAEEAVKESQDGCTTFGEMRNGHQWVGQNWDWQGDVLPNLVFLNIYPSDKTLPSCKVVGEAGLLGQTGMNEHGVSIVVNALYAADMDPSKISCTLIRRVMLRQDTKEKAIAEMERLGVAAVSHILIGDEAGAVSIETSPLESMSYLYPKDGIVTHTNHCIDPPPGVNHKDLSSCSRLRLKVLDEFLTTHKHLEPSYDKYLTVLKSEENYPNSICRSPCPELSGTRATSRTCYSTLLNCGEKKGRVQFGKPTEPLSAVEFSFGK